MPICLKKKKKEEKKRKKRVNTSRDCLLGRGSAFKEPSVQWETEQRQRKGNLDLGTNLCVELKMYKGPDPGQALC